MIDDKKVKMVLEKLQELKDKYIGKSVILPWGFYHICKVFAMGEEGAEFFGFVYDVADVVKPDDDSDWDVDNAFDVLEKQFEEHFKTKENIVVAINEKKDHEHWKEQYYKVFPKEWQQPIYE
jgi:hypothetical protein